MDKTFASAELQSLPRVSFGDGPEMADALLHLILGGHKRATWLSAADGRKDTEVGDRWVVVNGTGHPRDVLEINKLR
ncbi:MAG: hypothetical protein WBA68_10880 [Alteraurantiacibacter sp.]